MKSVRSLLIIAMSLIAGCTNDRLSFNALSDAIQPRGSVSTTERIDYHQGGGITKAQIANMQNYAKNQPTHAMRQLIGSPNRIDGDTEIYHIRGTGNEIEAPQDFVVQYRSAQSCNYKCSEAYSWYQD